MCQDTGTAIVMGKKSEGVLTGADDSETISRGVFDAYTKLNPVVAYLAGSPHSRLEESRASMLSTTSSHIHSFMRPEDGRCSDDPWRPSR